MIKKRVQEIIKKKYAELEEQAVFDVYLPAKKYLSEKIPQTKEGSYLDKHRDSYDIVIGGNDCLDKLKDLGLNPDLYEPVPGRGWISLHTVLPNGKSLTLKLTNADNPNLPSCFQLSGLSYNVHADQTAQLIAGFSNETILLGENSENLGKNIVVEEKTDDIALAMSEIKEQFQLLSLRTSKDLPKDLTETNTQSFGM